MPNCFQLISKRHKEAIPFAAIDSDISKDLGLPLHQTRYCCDWYDLIGFSLSMGASWEDIREVYSHDHDLMRIAKYLEEHYEARSWYEKR